MRDDVTPRLCRLLASAPPTDIESLPEEFVTDIFCAVSNKPGQNIWEHGPNFLSLISRGLSSESRTFRQTILKFLWSVCGTEVPSNMCGRLSEALRGAWDTGSDLRYDGAFAEAYFGAIIGLNRSSAWRPFYIKDHWQTMTYHSSSYLGRLSPIPDGFGALLKEAGDENVTNVWLKFAWRVFNGLDSDAQNQVVEATLNFHEGGTAIEGLEEYLPAAWASRPEHANSLAELAKVYLKLAWERRPSTWDPKLLGQISIPTAELYSQKGHAVMDEGMVKAWLRVAWSESGIQEDLSVERLVVEDATTELFKRCGDRVMDEFRELVDSVVVELEKNISYMELMMIDDEGKERCNKLGEKLGLMKRTRELLEDVCGHSQVTQ